MIKYKKETISYLVCDRYKEADFSCKRLPMDIQRVKMHPQNEWKTEYVDLCDACLKEFIAEIADLLRKFIIKKKIS